MKIRLRVFTCCETEAMVESMSLRFFVALYDFYPKQISAPKAHWKIPGVMVFTYELMDHESTTAMQFKKKIKGGMVSADENNESVKGSEITPSIFFGVPGVLWIEIAEFET